MTEQSTNGVRVTNQAIYDKLLQVERRLADVDLMVSKVIEPQMLETRIRLDRLEMRVYAILAGLLAAAIGAKGIGLI